MSGAQERTALLRTRFVENKGKFGAVKRVCYTVLAHSLIPALRIELGPQIKAEMIVLSARHP